MTAAHDSSAEQSEMESDKGRGREPSSPEARWCGRGGRRRSNGDENIHGERWPEAEKDDPIQRLMASRLDSLGGEIAEEVAILLDMTVRSGEVCGDGRELDADGCTFWTPTAFPRLKPCQQSPLAQRRRGRLERYVGQGGGARRGV